MNKLKNISTYAKINLVYFELFQNTSNLTPTVDETVEPMAVSGQITEEKKQSNADICGTSQLPEMAQQNDGPTVQEVLWRNAHYFCMIIMWFIIIRLNFNDILFFVELMFRGLLSNVYRTILVLLCNVCLFISHSFQLHYLQFLNSYGNYQTISSRFYIANFSNKLMPANNLFNIQFYVHDKHRGCKRFGSISYFVLLFSPSFSVLCIIFSHQMFKHR